MPEIKKEKSAKVPAEKYVTVDQFNELLEIVKGIATKPAVAATPEQVKKEKEIDAVNPDQVPVNPLWEAKAREVIGKGKDGDEIIDHCEMVYPKQGGALFTIVIKNEHSNAPKEYLQMYKQDRRTREIGNEGIMGVTNWALLIKQNLARPRAQSR